MGLKYIALMACGFWSFLAAAQPLENRIAALMQQHEAVGLATVVVKDNQIVYNRSFGYQDLASKTPLKETALFRIASISKSFTATAIMQLVARKKLSLDEDVSNLIGFKVRNPRYPQTVITSRMLLSHRSSLNDSNGYFTLDSINPSTTRNADKCYSDYAPGTRYQYCNLNFNIMGTIIERLTGQRFDVYINEHILRPLDLYGGYCVDSLDQERFASLYEYDAAQKKFEPAPEAYAPRREALAHYRIGYSAPLFSPTGGMKISAGDLARYMMMHMNYGKSNGIRVISKKLSRQMQQPLSEQSGYGMALFRTEKLIPGIELTGHTGSAYGLYSAMFYNPDKKYGFVVITNGCHYRETEGFVTLLKETVNLLNEALVQ